MDVSDDHKLAAISRDPHYQALIHERGRLGWILSAIMVTIFFGFILLVAYAGPLLGRSLPGMTTTIGVSGIGLTGLYVRIANRKFDTQLAALRKEHGL